MSMLRSSLRVLNYTVTPVSPKLGGVQRGGTLGEGNKVHKPRFIEIKKGHLTYSELSVNQSHSEEKSIVLTRGT